VRALNGTISPRPGDVWKYDDDVLGGEGIIGWKVLALVGKDAEVQKLDGMNVGYKCLYPIELMLNHQSWTIHSRRSDQVDAADYGFPCPECEQYVGIPEDDFICITCRANQLGIVL
jgi:hypothetical protein